MKYNFERVHINKYIYICVFLLQVSNVVSHYCHNRYK